MVYLYQSIRDECLDSLNLMGGWDISYVGYDCILCDYVKDTQEECERMEKVLETLMLESQIKP